MPNTKSAKKRIFTSAKAKLRNKTRKTAIKTAEKKFRAAVAEGDRAKAQGLLSEVFAKLDKAVKVGSIHKNKSSRKKSRLTELLPAAAAQA